MMKVILYTNGCPRCRILKARLDEKGIQYEVCDDIDLMLKKNFKSMPMLEVDGNVMDFVEAVNFIQETE